MLNYSKHTLATYRACDDCWLRCNTLEWWYASFYWLFSRWTSVSRLPPSVSFSICSGIVHPLRTDRNFSYPQHHPTVSFWNFLCVWFCQSTLWVRKNWTLFYLINFCKYCPIIIILSLLQTKIIYPKTCNWICHVTCSLLSHYLEKCNHIHLFTETVK